MGEDSDKKRKQAKLEEIAFLSKNIILVFPMYILLILVLYTLTLIFVNPDKAIFGLVTALVTLVVKSLLDAILTLLGFYFGSSKKQ